MSLIVRRAAFAGAASLAVVLASCGNPREQRLPETGASLEGYVTYGPEKVPLALIIIAGQGGSATGSVDETGHYKIENVPIGDVKIAVNTEAAKGELQGKLMSGYYKGPEAKKKGITAPPSIVSVPAKYSNPETSGLRTTIASGPNSHDISIPR